MTYELVRNTGSGALILIGPTRWRNVTALRDAYAFIGKKPDHEWTGQQIDGWIKTWRLIQDPAA